MDDLIKEELTNGVYLYYTESEEDILSAEYLGYILFDIDTMGNMYDYDVLEDSTGIIVYVV